MKRITRIGVAAICIAVWAGQSGCEKAERVADKKVEADLRQSREILLKAKDRNAATRPAYELLEKAARETGA